MVGNKLTIVVGPLLSLATNQVESLKKIGIDARLISHQVQASNFKKNYNTLSKENNLEDIQADISSNKPQIKFLYVMPVSYFSTLTSCDLFILRSG